MATVMNYLPPWVFTPQFAEDLEAGVLRTLARQVVERISVTMRETVVSGTSPAEMAGWSEKAQAVRAYRATGALADILTLESVGSLESVAMTVERIERNMAKFTLAEASIAGWRRSALNAIDEPTWLDHRELPGVPDLGQTF